MDDVSLHVSKCFSIKCRSVTRYKSDYICSTDEGMKIFRRFSGSAPEAEMCGRLTEKLRLSGFETVEYLLRTREDMSYSLFNDDIYTLSDYFPYQASDFSDRRDLLTVTGFLARLHFVGKNAVTGLRPPNGDTPDAGDIYAKKMKNLASYRRSVQSQPRMSDFDVIVMKNAEYYSGRLVRWKRFVEETGCVHMQADTVCHGNLKEENIRINGSVYFLNFSRSYIGNGVYDLRDVIRRHFKKSGGGGENVPISDITARYTDENPLSVDEINGLYAALLFPDRFLSLCDRLYSKKRTFVPAGLYARLEAETESAARYEDYIKPLIN